MSEWPSRIDSVPPACENAYQTRATVISGSTQATMTIDPITARTDPSALRRRMARAMPRTLWPMIAEPTTKMIVSQDDLMKT